MKFFPAKKPQYTIIKDHSTFFEDADGCCVTLQHNKKYLETFTGCDHSVLVQDAFSFAIDHSRQLGFSDFDLKYR